MPVWRETHHAWFWYGFERKDISSETRKFKKGIHDIHFFNPDFERLQDAVLDFTREANRIQAEIKGVVPLSGSVAETYSHADWYSSATANHAHGYGWGLGHGFGASYTGGFLVIFQRSEEITSEEFGRRMAALDQADRLADIDGRIREVEARRAEAAARLSLLPGSGAPLPEIVEKKPLIGGVKYHVGDKVFDARSTATTYIDTLTKEPLALQAEIADRDAELARLAEERRGAESS